MDGTLLSLRWVTTSSEPGARRRLWLLAIVLAFGSLLVLQAGTAHAAGNCPAGATMNIVAHQDDDLLFQSPDILHDIQSGKCVRTVYITAGERGGDMENLNSRESGVEAAYAEMAGAANNWTTSDAGISGHPMPLVTLAGHPTVSLVFMRLPAGVWADPLTPQDETLRNLWFGSVSQMHPEDGSPAYTKQGLISTLTALMTAFQPGTIRAQDYVGTLDDGDHDDHHVAAYFAHSAHLGYGVSHAFVGYLDYLTQAKPQNVFDPDLTAKTNAFYAYLAWDSAPCGETPDCSNTQFDDWIKRQYTVGTGSGGGDSPPSSGPITTFTAPTANQTVSGTINVAATAQDQSGTGMWLTAFRVDTQNGSPLALDYEAPWGFSLDTKTLANGPHTLYVRGADHANNVGADATVTFTVDNTTGSTGGGTGGTDPITSFTSPSANQTVGGTINVGATAQDQSGTGIWLTAFRVDTQNGSPLNLDYESPWGFSFDTKTLANGPHTLYVRAADHAGHVGQDATVTFTVDNSTGGTGGGTGTGGTDPITAFTSPTANQTVSGTINVAATAQDQSGTGMWLTAFRLDTQNGSPLNLDYEAPWAFSLDTTQLSNGTHTLYVRGADNAGHVGQDAAVTFTVDNSAGGTGGGPTGGGNGAPIVSFASPLANQTVSGTINVNATVQDQSGSGLWLAAFRVDSPDSAPSAIDYENPWGFSLDTTQLSNGVHTLFVRAEDNALNVSPDATVTFNVDNAGGAGG